MRLYINDKSLHGQFRNTKAFSVALDELMAMKNLVEEFDRQIYWDSSSFRYCKVTRDKTLPQIFRYIHPDKHRMLALLSANRRYDRQHASNDYFESRGQIVTDSVIGECAFLQNAGKNAQLASFTPSDWTVSPIEVEWHHSSDASQCINVLNHTSTKTLRTELHNADKIDPLAKSWNQLSAICIRRYPALIFSDEAFSFIRAEPFHPSIAGDIQTRLGVLNQLRIAVNSQGQRTPEGQDLYQKHFTGDKGWFSDSSDSEKSRFREKLRFKHPGNPNETVFASWHAKIKKRQMRIHFSWDRLSPKKPAYIVYVGPKITKK